MRAQEKKQKKRFIARNIKHPSFKNVDVQEATRLLEAAEFGEIVMRPSSKGLMNLSLTLKFYHEVAPSTRALSRGGARSRGEVDRGSRGGLEGGGGAAGLDERAPGMRLTRRRFWAGARRAPGEGPDRRVAGRRRSPRV